MILFDYGETILTEGDYNHLKGYQAVLDQCVCNPDNTTAEEVVDFTSELYQDIVKSMPADPMKNAIELHQQIFLRYIIEYFGARFTVPLVEAEKVFWQNSLPVSPTKDIEKLLDYLKHRNIRTGVISNLPFSSKSLKYFIDKHIPNHTFEFIITSSDYIFKKPHPRIFEIALRKANLQPQDTFYCGDNVINDIEGAYNNNITPVWYTRYSRHTNMPPSCDHIKIGDWNQLIALLDEIKE